MVWFGEDDKAECGEESIIFGPRGLSSQATGNSTENMGVIVSANVSQVVLLES
jgi:hypothetical protein